MTAPRFIGLAVLLSIAATTQVCAQSGPNIPFAPIEDTALKDPDYPAKKFRIDFARVEQEFPLTRQHLMSITPQNIVNLSQEQIDQIYGRLAAGPIPDGPHAGNLFFARGDRISAQADLHTRLQQILGGLGGGVAGAGIETVEGLARRALRGPAGSRCSAGWKDGARAPASRRWRTSGAGSGKATSSIATSACCAT